MIFVLEGNRSFLLPVMARRPRPCTPAPHALACATATRARWPPLHALAAPPREGSPAPLLAGAATLTGTMRARWIAHAAALARPCRYAHMPGRHVLLLARCHMCLLVPPRALACAAALAYAACVAGRRMRSVFPRLPRASPSCEVGKEREDRKDRREEWIMREKKKE